jgi:hypothetical protein
MSGAIPPLPQYASIVWCSVKAQGQLYIYLYHYLLYFRYSLHEIYLQIRQLFLFLFTILDICNIAVGRIRDSLQTVFFLFYVQIRQGSKFKMGCLPVLVRHCTICSLQDLYSTLWAADRGLPSSKFAHTVDFLGLRLANGVTGSLRVCRPSCQLLSSTLAVSLKW